MSAEELPERNRIPKGLEKAIAELAKRTVSEGLDPGKVLAHLLRFMEAWASLTPEQREAVRAELRRRRVPRVPENRKPRRYGEDR